MEPYELVLSEAAAITLASAARPEQRKLATILDRVKAAPFRSGDLQEHDSQGRTNEVRIEGDWLVTHWRDDAAREMRVVRLERVDE